MPTLNPQTKAEVLRILKERIQGDLSSISASQRSAQEGATHAENRAEGKKDMRATEVAYLARGLAERVIQLKQSAAVMEVFEPRDFAPEDPIGLGALVRAEDDDTEMEHLYFLVPMGGGKPVEVGGQKVSPLTPQSPLGKALIGKVVDDDATFRTPQGVRNLVILEVV